MKDIKKIVVVGGGTAGMVSALILKSRFPSMQIDMICSKKIGIIGVGEGSTEHWKEFMDIVGLDQYEMITETGATYKAGTLFKDWGVPDFMHSIQTGYDTQASQYPLVYGSQISQGRDSKYLSSSRFWENKINTWFISRPNEWPCNQFHFNTFGLNSYLTKVADRKGITIIDDEILDVTINENGEISALIGEKSKYEYDFYIDSTGFKKVLISKLGAKWVSYSKHLKTNATMVFQTPDTDEYNSYTTSKAMKHGWMFRTPVWGRWGNGYIFNDQHVSEEDAKKEAEEFIGHKVEIGKVIKFDPGRIDRVWIKNCCAIGLSASFVEPIEASSIGTTIQQTFMLMHRLINYNDAIINQYNKAVTELLENIRDFVVLHFICKRRDTDFWKEVANLPLPDSLEENLKIWKHHLPIREDFTGKTNYQLFKDMHFLMILHGLELFDVAAIKHEYDTLGASVHAYADHVFEHNHITLFSDTVGISHKKMLELVRSGVR